MILSLNLYEGCRSAEETQRGVHLYRLAYGDIGVRCAMGEEERLLDLVGIEER